MLIFLQIITSIILPSILPLTPHTSSITWTAQLPANTTLKIHLKDLVNLIQFDLFLLVQLVDVADLRVHQEEAKAHHLNKHVLLLRCEVHVVLKHVHTYVHYITCCGQDKYQFQHL